MPRLSSIDFDQAVEQALDRIPEEFLSHIREVTILVEEEPSKEVLEDLEVSEGDTLFGAYFGVPAGEKSVFDSTIEPDVIVIYRGPLEEYCETVEELTQEIEITVVHEIAHHFGIDEDVLARHGYG
jgi:predicted Zn-dependent protease with MMP-like domain